VVTKPPTYCLPRGDKTPLLVNTTEKRMNNKYQIALKEYGLQDLYQGWRSKHLSSQEQLSRRKVASPYRFWAMNEQPPKHIRKGSRKHSILSQLNAREKMRFTDFDEHRETGFSRDMRKLGSANLIFHPRRGEYQITEEGSDAHFDLTMEGRWINPVPNPYSRFGSNRSPRYRPESHNRFYSPENLIRKGTQKYHILNTLSQHYVYTRKEIMEDINSHNEQNVGMYLRRMEYAGIVERPAYGVYRVTPYGMHVLRTVDKLGEWRDE